MKIIQPKIEIFEKIDSINIIKKIESSARICYQSKPKSDSIEDKEKFIRNIIKSGHESVVEHVQISFDVISSRAIHLENVRHRIASYSAESTRYCRLNKEGISFVYPIGTPEELIGIWKRSCETSEKDYNEMMSICNQPQYARNVLNQSVKVHYRCSLNIRSLRNFFELRCDKAAHPEFKVLAISLLKYLSIGLSCLFDDIPYDETFYHEYLDGDRWMSYIDIKYNDNIIRDQTIPKIENTNQQWELVKTSNRQNHYFDEPITDEDYHVRRTVAQKDMD